VVQGGVVSRIRKAISESLPDFENETYGQSEPQLYSMIIKAERITYERNEKEFRDISSPKKNELLSITKCYIDESFRCSDSKRFAELCNDVPDYNNNDNDDDKLQGGLIPRIIYLLKKCRITNVRVNTRIGAWKLK
jgi:hypothetical protein